MKNLSDITIEHMPGLDYKCSCGKSHKVRIKNISIGKEILNQLPDLIRDYENKKVFIVEDKHTFQVAGKKVQKILNNKFKVTKYIFDDEHLVPNEITLGRLMMKIPQDTALIIAVGSGTINDISRFISCKIGIPYVIVGTAPSMDGYASVVSPLVCDGVKITYDAVYPMSIVADIDIMKRAPMQMIQAGLGDILGKYTALADWHLANTLKNEHFCTEIESLVLHSLKKCEEAVPGLTTRNENTVKNIIDSLILSGIAIGMVGLSRPASGSEHQLSHCYEMIFMNRGGTTKWLHGNTVGVGVGAAAYGYKYLENIDINEVLKKGEYLHLDRSKWRQNIKDVYTKSAENIIEFKEKSIDFKIEDRRSNMEKIVEKWDTIQSICHMNVPEPEKIIDILKKADAVWNPKDIGLDRELFRKSFIAAKDMRNRYGVFQLLEDIGELDKAADFAADIYYR